MIAMFTQHVYVLTFGLSSPEGLSYSYARNSSHASEMQSTALVAVNPGSCPRSGLHIYHHGASDWRSCTNRYKTCRLLLARMIHAALPALIAPLTMGTG
ncbi:hypothetical protein PENSPDRAFT_511495 [Peniophora sp. CONT]|nr:hypothetical protein PENSPDRAFT_511495 [Peniophora sp. CONT]